MKVLQKAALLRSSPLLRAGHHFRDEVDDGRGRLIGIHLGEQVTDVVCRAALLSGHKAKELCSATLWFAPLPLLWINVAERDRADGIMTSEEKLSLVVSECDALCRHLEVNNGG